MDRSLNAAAMVEAEACPGSKRPASEQTAERTAAGDDSSSVAGTFLRLGQPDARSTQIAQFSGGATTVRLLAEPAQPRFPVRVARLAPVCG